MENRLFRNVKGRYASGRTILVSAAVLVILSSCGNKESRPAGILSRDQMVSVMMQIYITEEKVNRLVLPRDSARQVFVTMRERIFDQSGVSDSVFQKSFDYYLARPKQMEVIYTAVVDSLQLKEQRVPNPRQPR